MEIGAAEAWPASPRSASNGISAYRFIIVLRSRSGRFLRFDITACSSNGGINRARIPSNEQAAHGLLPLLFPNPDIRHDGFPEPRSEIELEISIGDLRRERLVDDGAILALRSL